MRFSQVAMILFLLTIVGCKSVQVHRARQYSKDWNALDSATQERVLNAQIQMGDPSKTVYITLGTPQYTYIKENLFIWIYLGTFREATSNPPVSTEQSLPSFYTRAETRIPKRGEQRFQLHLSFDNDLLTHWELKPIDHKISARIKQYQLGTYPKWPRKP